MIVPWRYYDVFHLENLGDQLVGAAAEAANHLPNDAVATERCSVDVEEAGTIFVLCPLEC